MVKPRILLFVVTVFVVGAVLMGFEMLSSRYLYPYFGGGINTWAALISTVLYALAFGNFAGGYVATRLNPITASVSALVAAAAYLALVPSTADHALTFLLNSKGDGIASILLACALIVGVPIFFLGILSPIFVHLMDGRGMQHSTSVGLIYGVSTLGNVAGTLFTTYQLIPQFGSRNITYFFAAVLFLCAICAFLLFRGDLACMPKDKRAEPVPSSSPPERGESGP